MKPFLRSVALDRANERAKMPQKDLPKKIAEKAEVTCFLCY